MKSRKLNRFLAILGAVVITVTSTPITVLAAESVSEDTTTADSETSQNGNEESGGAVASATPTATIDNEEAATATPSPSAEVTTSSEEKEEAAPTATPSQATGMITALVMENTGASPSAQSDDADSGEGYVPVQPLSSETPIVKFDETSGKNAYHAVSSEFTTQSPADGKVLITKFTPSLTISYDLVLVPGRVTVGSETYNAQYGTDFLKSINSLNKGIIFGSGAEMATSTTDLDYITYVRFESGAKCKIASNTFNGWDDLTTVVGFGEALAAEGLTEVNFDKTFYKCRDLGATTIDLSGMTASFSNTFSGASSDPTYSNGGNRSNITIKNGNISDIEYLSYLVPTSSYGPDHKDYTTTFIDITFPRNDTDYLENAFTGMRGKLVFNNCKSDGSSALNFNSAFKNGTAFPYKDDNDSAGTDWGGVGAGEARSNCANITIQGVTAYSAESMFESFQGTTVNLEDFITKDTKSVAKMFKGATIANITGLDTWNIGAVPADEMFNGTRVYQGMDSHLVKTLIPNLKKISWKNVTSANKLFNFVSKQDYVIDYSGMDLSGVTDWTPSTLNNFHFITPTNNPTNYKLSTETLYALRAGTALSGKALDAIEVTDGTVAGSNIPTDTHVYTDIATISITDVATGKEVSTAVVPGYKLGDYLDKQRTYYQDKSLTQAVSLELDVNAGDKINVYCQMVNDEVEREIIEDAEVDFGDNPGSVEITLKDGSTDTLQGGTATTKIVIEEETPTQTEVAKMVIPSAAIKYAKSEFFNIDLIATIGGTEKSVSELSQEATITLPIPDDYMSGGIVMLNYHDGYDKTPIFITTDIDAANGTFTFKTDKFSPYVALYDDSVEMDSIDVTVKWVDDGADKSGRKSFHITDTVTYENGTTTTVYAEYAKSTVEDTTVVEVSFPKQSAGSNVASHSLGTVSVAGYTVTYDAGTYTYKLTKDTVLVEYDTVNITVDYSAMTAADFTRYVNDYATYTALPSVKVTSKYADNSTDTMFSEKVPLAVGTRVYTVPVQIRKNLTNGSLFTAIESIELSSTGWALYDNTYVTEPNVANKKLTLKVSADESTETQNYQFYVKVVDNSNASNTRPNTLNLTVVGKYGTYTKTKYTNIDMSTKTVNVYNGSVTLPLTIGGVALTSVTISQTTANANYISSWDAASKILRYTLNGAIDTDPDPGAAIDPINVSITFKNDTASNRPTSVTVTLLDSNNLNPITAVIDTSNANANVFSKSVDRTVNDTYHITSVNGIDSTKYTTTYNGYSIIATGKNTGTVAKSTKSVTVKYDDESNAAGLRPTKMTVKVSNSDKTETISQELTVGSENSYTFDVEVENGSDIYTVTSVSGVPDKYTVTMDGLTVTCKYTVEKISKTYSVKWEGDGDNGDKTRPDSVQLTIKNSSTTVQTLTASSSTNWAANASLNKYVKGVEAAYTLEAADVTNYSKSVSGDTVTYKFTGTLSSATAAVENSKNGTSATSDGTSTEATEPDYSIDNFDWIDYANRYPDLKKAYGYNKEALYAHYIRYGIGEGRIATFTGKYNTVNEDILAAYFPSDYKYKTDLSSTNPEYTIGKDTTSSTSSKVTVDKDGNIHTIVDNGDGTVTETVTDAEGEILSVNTYKTGDFRIEDVSAWLVVLGVLLLAIAGFIVRVVIKDDKKKKAVISMIS